MASKSSPMRQIKQLIRLKQQGYAKKGVARRWQINILSAYSMIA